MKSAHLAAALSTALLLPAVAPAAPARVSFSGCPVAGVENGCVIVKSGGQTYDVTAAKPPISIGGLGIRGSGAPGGVSTCMQGTVLTDIHYTYSRSRCVKPR